MSAGKPFRAVVVGCSAGGLDALRLLLAPLPADFPLPIVVVAHLAPDSGSLLAELLDNACTLAVAEAAEKEVVQPGRVYIAPPGYHLLVEQDESLSLSVDEKVCNVRPSIDVLFQSAADVWAERLIGVLLTGANSDGTVGLRAVKGRGGYCLVQDPARAFAKTMPRSAISAGLADCLLPLDDMGRRLAALVEPGGDR
jgi:two-component system chemotaxis response regulator CheB